MRPWLIGWTWESVERRPSCSVPIVSRGGWVAGRSGRGLCPGSRGCLFVPLVRKECALCWHVVANKVRIGRGDGLGGVDHMGTVRDHSADQGAKACSPLGACRCRPACDVHPPSQIATLHQEMIKLKGIYLPRGWTLAAKERRS